MHFVWRADTQVLAGHSACVSVLTFSPDGNSIASGSWDGTVQISDARACEKQLEMVGHADAIMAVTFSTNGQCVASASCDKSVKVWNLENGREERSFKGHSSYVRALVFSPNAQSLASGSIDGTIVLWHLETSNPVRMFAAHSDSIWTLAFSPDGYYIASGSWDTTIKLWNTKTGGMVKCMVSDFDPVTAVVFSPSGTRIATGSTDQITVWNVSTGEAEQVWKVDVRSASITGLRFCATGELVLSNAGCLLVGDHCSGASALPDNIRHLHVKHEMIWYSNRPLCQVPGAVQLSCNDVSMDCLAFGCRDGHIIVMQFTFDYPPVL